MKITREQREQAIIDALRATPMGQGALVNAVGMPKGTVKDIVERLRSEGRLSRQLVDLRNYHYFVVESPAPVCGDGLRDPLVAALFGWPAVTQLG